MRNFFSWKRDPIQDRYPITRTKVLHVANTNLYGFVYEMQEIEICRMTAPLFSLESDRDKEEVVVKTWGTLSLVEVPEEGKEIVKLTLIQENGESLLDCMHTAGRRLYNDGSYLVSSLVSSVRTPGVLPRVVHTLENIEDLWAEADHFLSGVPPRGYEDLWEDTDYDPQPLPFGKEVAVEPPIPQENTPSGNEGTHISDEDLRLGLAKALAEEKLDALYGDIDYLQEAIARDILEGRMDVGVDLKGLTREDLIKALTVLAGGADA